ncbi:MAG TPA: hypothetical protein VL095_12320 [Flavisolibacter sp.]|nr:hypothetical protein [Flavisolibacter sp.]
MRNLLTAVLAALSIGLFSCQKEVKDIFSNTGGGASGTRLIKTVEKMGADSVVTVYTYNSSGKIIKADFVGVEAGQPYSLSYTYVRNSSGVIQKQILESSDFAAAGIDSIVSIVKFDAGSNRYQNSVTDFSLFGIPLLDSVAFQYDGSGRLTSEIDYNDVGFGYLPGWKKEYTYNGTNVATEKYYSFDFTSSDFVLEDTYTYEYDTKINPLQFAADAPVLNLFPFYSSNNLAKLTYVASDPADNFTSTINYTYNSSNRPLTDVTTTGSDVSSTTYYYQ